MNTYLCPQDHQSIDPDYCSQCGSKIAVLIADDTKTADAKQWQIAISIDSQPLIADSPVPPSRPTQVVDLAVGSYLIGRTSQKRAVLPEISLDFDDAVSHRHAILEMRTDRSLIVRDIGSANGTSLNGHKIPLTRDIPLQDGDIVTLGHWTKITIAKK